MKVGIYYVSCFVIKCFSCPIFHLSYRRWDHWDSLIVDEEQYKWTYIVSRISPHGQLYRAKLMVFAFSLCCRPPANYSKHLVSKDIDLGSRMSVSPGYVLTWRSISHVTCMGPLTVDQFHVISLPVTDGGGYLGCNCIPSPAMSDQTTVMFIWMKWQATHEMLSEWKAWWATVICVVDISTGP